MVVHQCSLFALKISTGPLNCTQIFCVLLLCTLDESILCRTIYLFSVATYSLPFEKLTHFFAETKNNLKQNRKKNASLSSFGIYRRRKKNRYKQKRTNGAAVIVCIIVSQSPYSLHSFFWCMLSPMLDDTVQNNSCFFAVQTFL